MYRDAAGQQVWPGSASGTIQAPYNPLPHSHHMSPAAVNPLGDQQHHYCERTHDNINVHAYIILLYTRTDADSYDNILYTASFGPYPPMPPTLATPPRHPQNFPTLPKLPSEFFC